MIEKKIVVGFTVMCAMALAIGAISYRSNQQFLQATRLVENSQNELRNIEQMGLLLKDVETASRGYALTGDKAFLVPMNDAIAELPKRISELRSQNIEHPSQLVKLDTLEKWAEAKMQWARIVQDTRTHFGLRESARLISSGTGKRLMDRIQIQVNTMMKDEEELLAASLETEKSRSSSSLAIVLVGMVFQLSVLVFVYVAVSRDITGRRRAEVKLRQAGAYNRSLIEASLDPLVTISPDGRVTDVNEATIKVTGVSRERLIGTDFSDYCTEPDMARAGYRRVFEVGFVTDYPLTIRHTSGKLTDVLYNASVYKDENGQVLGVFAAARDITERKRAEERTKQLQEYLQLQIERMPIGLITWDKEFRVESWNPAAEKMFGFTQEEALGKHPYDLIVPKEAQAIVDDIWRRLLEGDETAHSVNENTTKGGQKIICSWANTPLKEVGGTVIGVLSMVQDITERKRAEMEIARVNRVLQMLSDTNQALIHITDEATLLNEVCRIAVDVGGYRMAWVGFAEHDEAKTLRPVAHAGFESGYIESANVTWADNERGRGPGGTAIRTGQPCMARNIPLNPAFAPWREAATQRGYKSIIALPLISEGQTLGALGIYSGETDAFDTKEVDILKELGGDLGFGITALRTRAKRNQAEEEIHKLNAELESRVIQRTAQLETANKELEAFSYSVSHDLRAPLRSIDGFSRIILGDYANKLDAEGRRLLNVICSSTRKMDELITDLLDLSRVGRNEMKSLRIDMTALAESIYREIASPEVQKQFAFSVAPLPVAHGDPSLLKQVWRNLISNAIKFTAPKDIRKIDIGGHAEKGMNEYFIGDSGVGFDPRYTHKLFGVFQRLHKAEEFEGTGVGLAIVQRIIHRHGGRVWAEGKVGEGAVFFFSLPSKEIIHEQVQ